MTPDSRRRALVVIGGVLARQRGRTAPTDLDRARAQELYDALVAEALDWLAEQRRSGLPAVSCAGCGRALPPSEARAGFTECEFCAGHSTVLRAVPDPATERSAT